MLLFEASCRGDFGTVKDLLEKRGEFIHVNDKDANGWTPLMYGARYGYSDIVQILEISGADANESSNEGLTALMLATINNHEETVKVLLDCRADIHARDKEGRTAYGIAVEHHFEEIMDLLKSYGAKE